jgi:hypothetical protein
MNSPTKDSKIVMRGEKGKRIDEKNFKMEYTYTIVINPESCQDRRAFVGQEQFDTELRTEMIRLVDEFLES